MSISEELEKLEKMRESGGLSEEEFVRAKEKVLAQASVSSSNAGFLSSSAPYPVQVRQWSMLLHLSLLAGFVVPLAGLVAPILIWQLKKTEIPELDVHGKIVANWIISLLIYYFIGFILLFVFVGVLILPVLAIIGIIFPIIGALKASNGETWKYPLAIEFIK